MCAASGLGRLPVSATHIHCGEVVGEVVPNLGISYRQCYSALPYSKLAN